MANTLTTIIGTTSVPVLSIATSAQEATINDVADGRSTASFTVNDDIVYTLSQGSAVSLTTTNEGILFLGFVDSIEFNRSGMLTPNRQHVVLCKDGTWLAEKRQFTHNEYVGRTAGDIVCDVHLNWLAAEGVNASYASDYDHDSTTFGAGTQTNTSAANNDLELAQAGTTFSKVETTTADFNTGTLSGVTAANNQLQLATTNALRMRGTAANNISSNMYNYQQIWTDSYVFQTGDYIQWDIWISSTSPEISGGPDLVMTDGTTWRDHVGSTGLHDCLDQFQLWMHPSTTLSSYANDQWYTRKVIVPSSIVGKTTRYASVALEGNTNGEYTFYVRNFKIYNSSNVVQKTIYGGASSISTNQLGNAGYYNVTVKAIATYEVSGSRLSPARSLSGIGCLQESIISWNSSIPVQPASSSQTYLLPLDVQTSTDNGATYQSCTNHGPIPNLPAGTTMSKSVLVKQVLAVSGPNPELTPILTDCTLTAVTGFVVAKTDVYQETRTSTDFGTGTLSNVQYDSSLSPSGLKITGKYLNFDDGGVSGLNIFGSDTVAPPTLNNALKACGCRAAGTSDAKIQLVNEGQPADGVMECDVQIVDSNAGNCYGILYRTTFWGSGQNTYGYRAHISANQVTFGHGTNASSGAWNQLASIAVTFTPGQWYHIKAVFTGSSHTIYVDNVQYIQVTDTFYTGAGYMGFMYYNAGSIRASGAWDNFGEMNNTFSGVRTAPSLSVSACGVVQNSVIEWIESTPPNCSVLVEAQLASGGWLACTNGGQIPGVLPGTNCSGKSLQVRMTLTTQNSSATPVITGMSWMVIGNYAAAGNRVSPLLNLAPAGVCGSSSVTWTSNEPAGTAVGMDISLSSATGPWTAVTNGAVVPGLVQGAPVAFDDFLVNSSANYNNTFFSGGVIGTPTFDTANSRLIFSGGTNAAYLYTPLSFADGWIESDMDWANVAGLVLRYLSATQCYFLKISDASSPTNPNTIQLFKNNAGLAQIGSTAVINFVRGTYHKIHFEVVGTTLVVKFDGVTIITATDASISGAGNAGVYQNVKGQYYSLSIQQYGANLTGINLWSRARLTSTDPTVTPKLQTLSVVVRNTNIETGIVIPATSYQYQKSLSEVIDDVAKQSNLWWNINRQKNLLLQSKPAFPAPWVMQSTDMLYATIPKLKQYSPAYRNRQYVIGGVTIVPKQESKVGNGFTQSWTATLPVDSILSITLHGTAYAYTFGVSGVDTGKDFYYTKGSINITQDASETPLDNNAIIDILYNSQTPVIAVSNNVPQQTALALLDGSTGIVEQTETIAGLSQVAAQAVADARITQFAILAKEWRFSTNRAGLLPGMWLTVFVPEYSLFDMHFLIVEVDLTLQPALDAVGNADILIQYDVICMDGQYLGQWSQLFTRLNTA